MKPLDENTPAPMRLGLIVLLTTTCLGLIGGIVGSVWWWASWSSRIDTMLTSIQSSMSAVAATNTRNGEEITAIDRRVSKLEVIGSPAVQQMQKDVNELLRQFDLHRAREGKQ